MLVLVTYKFDENTIKSDGAILLTNFLHYKSIGAFGYHGNQSFDPISLQNLTQPFPQPNNATYNFSQLKSQ